MTSVKERLTNDELVLGKDVEEDSGKEDEKPSFIAIRNEVSPQVIAS